MWWVSSAAGRYRRCPAHTNAHWPTACSPGGGVGDAIAFSHRHTNRPAHSYTSAAYANAADTFANAVAAFSYQLTTTFTNQPTAAPIRQPAGSCSYQPASTCSAQR